MLDNLVISGAKYIFIPTVMSPGKFTPMLDLIPLCSNSLLSDKAGFFTSEYNNKIREYVEAQIANGSYEGVDIRFIFIS